MKRFYQKVSIGDEPDGHAILLDGKPVKTPDGKAIRIGSKALAQAVAEEWRAQGDAIKLADMPFTRLSGSLCVIGDGERAAMRADLAGYAQTDLLCYHADQPPLEARQQAQWEPVLQWIEQRYGVRFHRALGVMPVAQPEASIVAIAQAIDALDDARLLVAAQMVPVLGSVLLGLAVLEGHLTAEQAFALSQLDEQYQIELWGEDEEAATARQNKACAVAQLAQFMALCGY